MIEGRTVAAVVPAYNEGRSYKRHWRGISSFVERIQVVDDASKDATVGSGHTVAAEDPRVAVLVQRACGTFRRGPSNGIGKTSGIPTQARDSVALGGRVRLAHGPAVRHRDFHPLVLSTWRVRQAVGLTLTTYALSSTSCSNPLTPGTVTLAAPPLTFGVLLTLFAMRCGSTCTRTKI
jgi:hypothetical protein